MAITASAVQELRKLTSAGMMACKKALTETNGDLEAAAKLLREKGEAKRSDRADRETSEGITCAHVAEDGKSGVLLVVNCETDFVAKNEGFQAYVAELAAAVAAGGASTPEEAAAATFGEGTIENSLGAKFSELGEVIKISKVARFEAASGSVASYIHMGGKVGVLLNLAHENADTDVSTLAKDINLHIAAAAPASLTRDGIDATVIEEENDINRKQLLAEGKPEQIIENILKGKINKFYSEQVLLEQGFVKDPSVSITDLLSSKSKELSDTVTITEYARFTVGA